MAFSKMARNPVGRWPFFQLCDVLEVSTRENQTAYFISSILDETNLGCFYASKIIYFINYSILIYLFAIVVKDLAPFPSIKIE